MDLSINSPVCGQTVPRSQERSKHSSNPRARAEFQPSTMLLLIHAVMFFFLGKKKKSLFEGSSIYKKIRSLKITLKPFDRAMKGSVRKTQAALPTPQPLLPTPLAARLHQTVSGHTNPMPNLCLEIHLPSLKRSIISPLPEREKWILSYMQDWKQ